MMGSFRLRIGIISVVGIILVVIGGHFSGGDHFDGGDHFGGGTGLDNMVTLNLVLTDIENYCPLQKYGQYELIWSL